MRLAAAAVGFLALFAAGPAAAQFFAPPESIPGLSPGAVRRLMAERGFRVLTPPFRRGDVYVVDAVDDRDGRQIRIIVGAYAGRILQTFAVGRGPLPPNRPVAADDRLPFPGESTDDDGRRLRGRGPREDTGDGLFGMFSRPADGPDRTVPSDPSIVPGLGPQDTPRPRRVARPKPPPSPRTVVRGAPPPLPGPKTLPAAADAKAVEEVKPVPAPALAPPAPKPAPAPAVRREAPPAAPVARREEAPADIGPRVRPVERGAPSAPPKPQAAQSGAAPKPAADAPPKPAPKKRAGPLNDIPPAPLD